MILLLSILLGTLLQECQGLQAGFQYQYQYTGTISTWIPNDPKQSSGSALRANVALQLTQNGDILVKTSNIEVGERNGEDACEAYKHAEFPYREMDPEDAALLETPFLVHVNRTEVSYLEVPQEPVWVTNIRRGIINTIPIIPLTGQHFPTLTFKIKEDTMIGSCYNWYSMLKLSDHLAKLENKKQEEIIEVDVQRERVASYSASGAKGRKTTAKGRKGPSKTSKTHRRPADEYSVAPIPDTLSKLTRTLDVDQCKDNHFVMKINGNEESVERTQRSSEGTFLMRGEGKLLRLERAKVKGNIVIYTGESDEEFIRTTSKQVLQLRMVTRVEEPFSITYVPERRAVSFSVADGPRSNIKEKLLGITPDNQQIEANNEGIVEDLLTLKPEDSTPGTERPHFLETFQRLVERMTISSWTEIEGLISVMANTEREKQIIYQAFLASGRDEVLTAFLEKTKEYSFRANNSLLVFQVFEAPTTPVRNPALIPAMLEVVSDMHEDEDVSKAASLLNIARLANRYCLDSRTANICEPGCDNDFILNTFLPILSRGLQDPHKWKRLVHVQAICALGSPYSVALLQPIIEGANNEDIDVRTNAISCLIGYHLPKTAQDMVFDTLVPLVDNPAEFPEVRSMAFLALTTWEAHLSWWEHVAISTWKETSAQLVSFISSTLLSLSDGSDPRSENAKKVVHLAKHPQGSEVASLSRSMFLYLEEVVKNCKIGSNVKMAWLSSTESAFPRSVYYQLQLITAMGMTRKETGVYVTNAGKFLYRYYHSATHSPKKHEDFMTFREIYEELKEELELPTTPISDEPFFKFLLISEPLPVILSVDEQYHPKQNLLSLIYKSAIQKVPLHFRLVDSTLVLTSDFGLPIVVKHEEDFAITLGGDFTVLSLSHFTVRPSLSVNHRNALKTNTLVPWSKGFAAGAGVEASLDVTLPLTMIDWQMRQNTATVILELLAQQQVKVMSRSNVIYTSLTPLYHIVDSIITPEESDSNNRGRKVVRNREMHESRYPDLSIYLQAEWKGDFEQPRDFNLLSNMSVTQLKYSNFDYKIVLNPENYGSKRVTFTFNGDIKEGEERFTEQVRGQEGQLTQGADDYELFSQVSQSSSTGFVDYEQTFGAEDFEQQGQHSQAFNSHLEKMQALMMPSTGGKVYTFTVSVVPQNSPRKYEMAINTAASRGNIGEEITTQIQKIHITTLSHPAPGVIGDTYLVCYDLRTESPFLLPLVTKEMLLETNFTSKFFVSVYGDNCEAPATVKLESTIDVSSAAIQNMHSTEERQTCEGDFPRPIYPFYNQVHFKATTAEDLPGNIAPVLAREVDPISSIIKRNEPPRPNNEVIIDATMDTESGLWNVTVVDPKMTAFLVVDEEPLLSNFYDSDAYDAFEKVCHLTHQSVKTYDGLVHPFEPSSCWTTATIVPFSVPSSISSSHDIAVQVRFTDQWEVRLISPASALVLDVTRSEILVNEEPFSGHSEKFVLHRLQDSHMVGIGMVAVRVGDTVDITVSNLYYGKVVGICGNHDGEPINDMMGPTGCLYTDPALHTVAWSTPGVGCSRFSLRNEKRTLAEYRENCDKVFFQPTGVSQHNAMANCTEWKYDERSDPTGLYCKSMVPTPTCLPGCHPNNALTKHVRYSCRIPSSPEQGGVQYGENAQCFSTVSPVLSFSGCYHP